MKRKSSQATYLKKSLPTQRFHSRMVEYVNEYQAYLLLQKSDGTGISDYDVAHEFVNYLLNHHLVTSFEEITVGMANSGFYKCYVRQNATYYESHNIENIELLSKEEIKNILKGFFVFIYGKYGIKNEKVMKGLRR